MLNLLIRVGEVPEALPPVKHLMQGLLNENIVWGIRLALLAGIVVIVGLYVIYSWKNRNKPNDKGE